MKYRNCNDTSNNTYMHIHTRTFVATANQGLKQACVRTCGKRVRCTNTPNKDDAHVFGCGQHGRALETHEIPFMLIECVGACTHEKMSLVSERECS